MRIPNAMDVEFSQVEGNLPEHNCNCCGKPLENSMYIGDIKLTGDASFSIVLCSQQCVEDFQRHPSADDYIRNAIERIFKSE